MNMRNRLFVCALIGLIGFAAGCKQTSEPSPSPDEETTPTAATAQPDRQKTIALSVLTMNNPFFKVIADTMAEGAAKHGYDVLAVSGDFDVAKQQNQVKDFIVRGVSAIVLCPCDSKAIGPAIKEANDAGIPVFTADIACLAPGVDVVCHVATDNYGGGREAAKAMIEALGGKGKVAILDHPEVESVILRTRGFQDELKEANQQSAVNIEIVAILPGGAAREKSYRAAQDLIQSYPDLHGIFCINDPTAFGAIAALEEAGKLDQVAIVGFDGQPEGKQMIKEGKIYADPIQFPDQIGAKTVDVIMKYFAGEQVPAEILIPTALYTKEDAMKDPALE
jgi:ribose transport system substrate-binding protein